LPPCKKTVIYTKELSRLHILNEESQPKLHERDKNTKSSSNRGGFWSKKIIISLLLAQASFVEAASPTFFLFPTDIKIQDLTLADQAIPILKENANKIADSPFSLAIAELPKEVTKKAHSGTLAIAEPPEAKTPPNIPSSAVSYLCLN
jgi:hypothetical protein